MNSAVELSFETLSSNPGAFSLVYELYVRRVYDFVFYRISDKPDAEDITSEVFFKALRSLSSFRGKTEAEFSSWIFSIAYRSVVDAYKKRWEEVLDIDDHEDSVSTSENHGAKIDASETLEEVSMYLETLPKKHKDILIMAVWDELPYDQIASIMNISEANCRQIVSRTLRKIEANVTFLVCLFFIFNR